MAAKKTIKVALKTGAAKDDFLSTDATGLSEDLLLASLNVLENDPGSARLYSLQQNLSGTCHMAKVNTAFSALGAQITINADGTIAYDASNVRNSLAHLAEGQLVTDNFVYTVRMGNGALSSALVTLQIAGENDIPELDSITPVNINDTAADDTPTAASGMLSGQDVDDGASLTYSLADMTDVDISVAGVQTKQMEYGTLTLHTGTGAYAFLADPDKIDALSAGSNQEIVFGLKVTDEYGASASQDLKLYLVGANDNAEIFGDTSGTANEDSTLPTSGALVVSDRDAGAVGFVTTTSLHGTYGDFTFNDTSGLWTYTLRNGDANVQALAFNQQVDDTLTVTSQDGTATQEIVVTVNGVNDSASITGTHTGSVTEDGTLTAGGTLGVTDPDDNPANPLFQSVSTSALNGNYGDFTFNTATGVWGYTLRNSDANVQALGAGSSVSDVMTVTSQDGTTTQEIAVSVNGVNDSASITGTSTDSVAEDGDLTAGGTLGVTDIDDNPANPIFQSVSAAALHATYGDFSFNSSTGIWTYALRNSDANVQGLALNQQVNDTLTVTSQDGTASRAITVTVNGAAEASTGGGGGTTPPTDPAIVFNIGLQQIFGQTGDYLPVLNFTQNDLINFSDGIQYLGFILDDYIPGDSNPQDSTALQVALPTLGGAPPELFEIILIGFTNFDSSMIFPS